MKIKAKTYLVHLKIAMKMLLLNKRQNKHTDLKESLKKATNLYQVMILIENHFFKEELMEAFSNPSRVWDSINDVMEKILDIKNLDESRFKELRKIVKDCMDNSPNKNDLYQLTSFGKSTFNLNNLHTVPPKGMKYTDACPFFHKLSQEWLTE